MVSMQSLPGPACRSRAVALLGGVSGVRAKASDCTWDDSSMRNLFSTADVQA